MIVYVLEITGQKHKIEIETHELIEDLKNKIYINTGFFTSQQRLIFQEKELQDHQKLSYYNILNESKIYMTLRLYGD